MLRRGCRDQRRRSQLPRGYRQFAAGTCWHCTETGGTAEIAFCGFVAGESFVKKNSGGNKSTTKYSFTLADDLGASRVINTSATLQKFNTDISIWENVGDPVPEDTSCLVNGGDDSSTFCGNGGICPTDPCTGIDYSYYGNAGVFGNSGVYSYLHAPTYMAAAYVTTILTQDNFTNNDGDLCYYSQTAPFHGSFTVTEEGSYRIVIAGTVKGNSAIGNQPFSVTSDTTVGGACVHESPDNLPPCNP